MSSSNYRETYRSIVRPEDCDALGHMNVQHYFGAVSSGMFVMMEWLGLSRQEIDRRRLSFAVVRAETDFRRELYAGESMALESTISQMGEKVVVFHHRLRNLTTGEVAMATDYKCVLLDLDCRRSIILPDDVRAAAATLFPSIATA